MSNRGLRPCGHWRVIARRQVGLLVTALFYSIRMRAGGVHVGLRAAIPIFCCALVWAQDSLESVLRHAIALHQAGHVEQAIPEYRAYLAAHPENVDARSNLGAALATTGRYEDAVAEYRSALKGRPGDTRIRLNLALAFYKAGRISDAASELSALHAVNPANRQAILVLADCWLQQGENQRVIELIAPIQKTEPDNLAFAYLLGTALLREKQIGPAQVLIDRILRKGDSAEAHFLLGTAKMSALDFPGAIAEFENAAKLNPKLPDVYAFLGLAHRESGNLEAARADFQNELQQNPNEFESNLNLAVLLKEDQDYKGARKLLDRALRVRPGHAAALYQLAAIDLATGNLDQARAGLEAIVSKEPKFLEAHISLAQVYYRLKRKEDGDREKTIVQKLTAERDQKEK
jgi:tetratricopeptide (TPR) repeat protein